MFFAIALDVLVALYILSRQRRIRSVPRRLSLRFPVVVGVIGLIDLLSYSDTHHPSHHDYLWLLATLVVGGLLLGAIRALTVKIWTSNSWVVRQGTGLTMALWVVSLVLHFLGGIGAQHAGAANLEASSFLLYLGLTYGVQNFVVHRRAVPLWNALGPEAGQRLHVNFGQGPGGPGAFFATFRGDGQGFGPGFGAGSGRAASHDPTIIDAEVVDDDEGPPQLR
jgi:hypothetical protein